MARLVSCDEDVMHARTHGIMSSSDLNFFRDRAERSAREVGHFRSAFMQESFDAIATFDLADLRDRVDASNTRFEHRWQDNIVRELSSLDDFRHAMSINRRYLMSDPRVRKLHIAGRIDGFGDLYNDEDPTASPMEHQANREVITGSHEIDAEGRDAWRSCLGTVDENGDQTLRFLQRGIVRDNRVRLHEILDKGGLDPTSVLGKTM